MMRSVFSYRLTHSGERVAGGVANASATRTITLPIVRLKNPPVHSRRKGLFPETLILPRGYVPQQTFSRARFFVNSIHAVAGRRTLWSARRLRRLREEIQMAKQKDPVCGMQIDESDATGTSEHHGKTYYFCSPACKQKFDESPERYTEQ